MPKRATAQTREWARAALECFERELLNELETRSSLIRFPTRRELIDNGHLRLDKCRANAKDQWATLLLMHERRWRIVVHVQPTAADETWVAYLTVAVHVLEHLCKTETKSILGMVPSRRARYLTKIKSSNSAAAGRTGRLVGSLLAKGQWTP